MFGSLLLVMAYIAQIYQPLQLLTNKITDLQAWLVSLEFAVPGLAPKATVGVPGAKLVPVIVTTVPSPVEPVAGLIEVTAGAAWT